MIRIALAAVLISCISAVAEEKNLSIRHVSVTGTAVSRVQPDTVVWNVDVRRNNRELATAQSQCDDAVKQVLTLRTDFKLKPEDVQTGYVSVRKVYDRDNNGNQTTFRHFLVERTITIRMQDTSRFDEVFVKLVAADVELSYSLASSEYTSLRKKTRLEAVAAARTKATEMTELLGAKVGRVLCIAEPQPAWSDNILSNTNSVALRPQDAESDETPGTFAPGAIQVSVSVDVSFEIE